MPAAPPPSRRTPAHPAPWRAALYRVIFEHDTRAGKAFDVALIAAIALSITAVCLESVPHINQQYGPALVAVEWAFTILFAIEYVLRLVAVRRPLHYALSFFGVVDLLAVVPTFAALFVPGAQELLVIRALRVLRVFRVLKMGEYLAEAGLLTAALSRARRKITVFVATVLTLVLIVGAMMHLIEGPANGFTSIPISVYWAIVTLTTVGYGDIAPKTPLGQLLASAVMITGYGIIAVPTGIVTAELVRGGATTPKDARKCPTCDADDHDVDASHCKYCGAPL
ncbi:MAG TPA: ion transporter [Tepidisphaeraceae bacterium]|nr:ion transporter [Tepidisphaeraceae bacterium]